MHSELCQGDESRWQGITARTTSRQLLRAEACQQVRNGAQPNHQFPRSQQKSNHIPPSSGGMKNAPRRAHLSGGTSDPTFRLLRWLALRGSPPGKSGATCHLPKRLSCLPAGPAAAGEAGTA